MNLSPALRKRYTDEQLSAREAQRLAEFIAWGPVVFQASRLMVKWGILDLLRDADEGLTRQEICTQTGLSDYAVKCLLEASLCIGIIVVNPETDRFSITKAGWFLMNDRSTRVNMDLNHDVNYQGMFYLDESLKRFSTVYPACGSSNSAIGLTLEELERFSQCAGWVDVCKGWQ